MKLRMIPLYFLGAGRVACAPQAAHARFLCDTVSLNPKHALTNHVFIYWLREREERKKDLKAKSWSIQFFFILVISSVDFFLGR